MLLNASLCARTVEAKQTETLEFGIEKGLLQGHPSKENGWLMPKKPWTPQWFGGESFYRPNLGRELQGVWLLISWWWGERTVHQEPWAQPEVTILHLGGGPQFLHKNSKLSLCVSLQEEPGPAPRLHYCLLTSSPLSLHPLPSLISNCLNLPFGTPGRSWRLNEAYFLQTRNEGHGKDLYPGGAHRVLLGFNSKLSETT